MSISDLDDIVVTRLRSAQQRYTRGRQRIVRVLRDADGPMTIPRILDADRRLAQSSVYRNLTVLEEVGVVHRIVTTDDFAHYELAEDLTEHHHHLVCSSCGVVVDFSLPDRFESDLDRVLRRAAKRASFDIDHHRLDLVGQCTRCA